MPFTDPSADGQPDGPPAAIGAMRTLWAVCAVVGYLATIVAANGLTNTFGLVPVGFGLMATAGTWAAGAAFVARDAVQDTAGRWMVMVAIVAGAALSAVVSTAQLAVASGVAFLLSEAADMAVYTPLRARGYVRAAVASNVVGAVADTVVFLWLAGFGLTWAATAGQLLVKLAVTGVTVAAVLVARGALLRHRVHRTHPGGHA